MKEIPLGSSRFIGGNHPCIVVAEIGMNHNGELKLARQMIDSAKDCGADAVKFQIFTAEKLVTKGAKTYGAIKDHLPEYQQEMYKKYELAEDEYRALRDYCDEKGILFLASVFDEENADLLERVGTCAYKIASCDITHLPMLRYIARKNKPIILSTGMSTLDEVRDAVEAIKSEGNEQIVLTHCISSYPAEIDKSNLRAITTLKEEFGLPVGYSDHTPGEVSAISAVTLGAKLIEKHFTTDKSLPGVDHHLSMDPKDMKQMIDDIHLIEPGLGTGEKVVTEAEKETRAMARRSIISKTDIPAGTTISKEMLIIKRPGTGIAPKYLDRVVGKIAVKDIGAEVLISEEMLR